MKPSSNILSLVVAGSSAAEILETACERGPGAGDQAAERIALVRDLARDTKDQLEGLSRSAGPGPEESALDLISETAIQCADLANLAACNLDGLSTNEAFRAAAAVHLAAGTVNALRLLAEAEAGDRGSHAATRDLRGAGWRADLTVRQVEEFLEAIPEG